MWLAYTSTLKFTQGKLQYQIPWILNSWQFIDYDMNHKYTIH